MAVPTWQPGTLYQPGDIVQPITAPPPTAAQVENGDFAAGNVNWDFIGGAAFATSGGYSGNGNCVRMPGNVADGIALNRTKLVVPSTGSTFEATAMINQGASIRGATRGWVEVRWFDIDDAQIGAERGNVVDDGSGGAWHQSKVTATRPAGAAYARAGIALFSVADHSHPIWGDNLAVSGTFAGLPDGLVYKAVQPESGFSDSDEPAWPPLLGQQVIDNDVIWEAVASTRVTWEASPLYVSGAVEPEWPTDIGGFVRDGTIDWKTVSRRVEDPNCPDSKIVVIAASKVFAGDDDIVRYSATVNPLDWTTSDDAGYLPTGLQNYGANPVAAMGLYRGNLVVFNAEGFQLWQVDEDQASMSLIDALPLGSTHHRSIAPVSNDLFFAASKGVRSIGIAASSTNYQAGDVGMPIDPLVEPKIKEVMQGISRPLGLFHPALGQYWLGFPSYPPPPLVLEGNLPNAFSGATGVYQYTAAGGFNPYVFDIESGMLPPGASMDASGLVSFDYSAAGTYSWVVRVTDTAGNVATHPDTAVITETPSALLQLTPYTGDDTFPRVIGSLHTEGNGFALVSASTGVIGCLRGAYAKGAAKGTLDIGNGVRNEASLLQFGDGVTWPSIANMNALGVQYIQYLMKQHPLFCSIATYTGSGAVQDIPHQLGAVPGVIAIFSPNSTASPMFHRSAGPTIRSAFGGQFNNDVASATAWNSTAPTDEKFTVGPDAFVNTAGREYTAVLFAHEDGEFGLIRCGQYVGNGSASGPVVELGWIPKLIIILPAVRDGSVPPCILDTVTSPGFIGPDLPMELGQQTSTTAAELVSLTGSGFAIVSSNERLNTSGRVYRYIAFRGDLDA